MKFKMKYTLGLATLLIMTLVNVQASEHEGRHSGRASIDKEQIVKNLSLDDSTSKALLKLISHHRSNHKSHQDMNREQHHETRNNHREEVRSLLGDEKFAEFQKMMMSNHKSHGDKKCSKGDRKHQS